jgi:AcrR family transcriptional regulator
MDEVISLRWIRSFGFAGNACKKRDDLTSRKQRAQPAGVRRDQILAAATEYFGRNGYEDTKWADVAAAVGIGSTALYHYFDSKLHCLYVIMAESNDEFQRRFVEITTAEDDCVEALTAVLRANYELTPLQVLRNRVLIAEQGLMSIRRTSSREEEARQLARSRSRRLQRDWAMFLAAGMQQGSIPRQDPELLTRAILGLYNSAWHWYRPQGALSLDRLAEFYVARTLDLIGVEARNSTAVPAPFSTR